MTHDRAEPIPARSRVRAASTPFWTYGCRARPASARLRPCKVVEDEQHTLAVVATRGSVARGLLTALDQKIPVYETRDQALAATEDDA